MTKSPAQRSPGQRQPSVGKKVASAATPGAASPSVTKRQQGSQLDQELLALEKDAAKRHSRGLSEYLLEHSRKVEELQEKNRRLEEELSFDDHAAREDPFFNDQVAEKLSDLYVQGNDHMVRLELERKEVARLNLLIQESESALAQQKTKLYELAALDHNHGVLMGRVRKMENDVDRRIVKMNEKLNSNRKLRERVDAQRMERVRMDDIYTKVSLEVLSKQHKVARTRDEVQQLRDEVEALETQVDAVQQEGDEWEQTCDRRAAAILQELKEIALDQREPVELLDAGKYKFLGENELMRGLSTTEEDQLQTRVKRGWKASQARVATDSVLTKYQENRTFIEKIHEVSGTTTVSEMIDAFNNHTEAEHFDRIQHVNQLAEEIENHRQVISKLREDIGKLKHRKDSVDFQRMNRIEGLRAKLQFTIEQKKHKEAANQQLQAFLAALKPAIMLFHSRIGCADLHADSDLKKILGQVEEQIVNILQKYHAKIVADQASKLGDPSELSRSSPSKRESSANKLRRAMFALDGSPDSPEPRPQSTPSAEAGAGTHSPLYASLTAALGAASPDKTLNLKAITALVAKQQPYRYSGLRAPHMSVEELRKKDNVEEEYPLTYKELKSKVWHSDTLG